MSSISDMLKRLAANIQMADPQKPYELVNLHTMTDTTKLKLNNEEYVDTLPTNPEEHTLYLMKLPDSETRQAYIWRVPEGEPGHWETFGGGRVGEFIGEVDEETPHFPTTRPDGSSLVVHDYMTSSESAMYPFTIDGIAFNQFGDKVQWNGHNWEKVTTQGVTNIYMVLEDGTKVIVDKDEKDAALIGLDDSLTFFGNKLKHSFNEAIDPENPSTTKATSEKEVVEYIKTLDVDEVGEDAKYIKKIKEVDGKIEATLEPFDTEINKATTAATHKNAPTSKAVEDRIEKLDVEKKGADGKYIKYIEEVDGLIDPTLQPFDTKIDETTTAAHINAPTTKAVEERIKELDTTDDPLKNPHVSIAEIVTEEGEDKGKVQLYKVNEEDGIILRGDKDVLLAKVAHTGEAEDVHVKDVRLKFTADDVEEALEELYDTKLFNERVVSSLPTENIKGHTIYIKKISDDETESYIRDTVNNKWVPLSKFTDIPMLVGMINKNTEHFPDERESGDPLVNGDYVLAEDYGGADPFPFTVDGIVFNNEGEKAVWYQGIGWRKEVSGISNVKVDGTVLPKAIDDSVNLLTDDTLKYYGDPGDQKIGLDPKKVIPATGEIDPEVDDLKAPTVKAVRDAINELDTEDDITIAEIVQEGEHKDEITIYKLKEEDGILKRSDAGELYLKKVSWTGEAIDVNVQSTGFENDNVEDCLDELLLKKMWNEKVVAELPGPDPSDIDNHTIYIKDLGNNEYETYMYVEGEGKPDYWVMFSKVARVPMLVSEVSSIEKTPPIPTERPDSTPLVEGDYVVAVDSGEIDAFPFEILIPGGNTLVFESIGDMAVWSEENGWVMQPSYIKKIYLNNIELKKDKNAAVKVALDNTTLDYSTEDYQLKVKKHEEGILKADVDGMYVDVKTDKGLIIDANNKLDINNVDDILETSETDEIPNAKAVYDYVQEELEGVCYLDVEEATDDAYFFNEQPLELTPEQYYTKVSADNTFALIEDVGNKEDLLTEHNATLVAAINELVDIMRGSANVSFMKVAALPMTGERNKIYLIPTETINVYSRYIWSQTGEFVNIGTTEMDLSNYYDKVESDTSFARKDVYASENAFGITKVGEGIQVNGGVISVQDASGTLKGIMQVGTGLKVETGVVSAEIGTADFKTDALVTALSEASTDTEVPTAKAVWDEIAKHNIWYGTCASTKLTSHKIVDCEGFVLREGAVINVYFANGNTKADITLNINNGGRNNVNGYMDSVNGSMIWEAGSVVSFLYVNGAWTITSPARADVGSWGLSQVSSVAINGEAIANASVYAPVSKGADGQHVVSGANGIPVWENSKACWYGYCTNTAKENARVVVCDGFVLRQGSRISVVFSETNETTAMTMNVNNTGKYPIYASVGSVKKIPSAKCWGNGDVVDFVFTGNAWGMVKSAEADGEHLGLTRISNIKVNGFNTYAPEFYAPVGGGTTGQHLVSNGNSAPTWENSVACWYGTCNTAGAEPRKLVSCAGFVLRKGVRLAVKFTYANKADNILLDVNNDNCNQVFASNTDTMYQGIGAGQVVEFVYDGVRWMYVGPAKATESLYGASHVDTLTMNGKVNANPSFYAPVAQGLTGQILKSMGTNGAPVWVNPIDIVKKPALESAYPIGTVVTTVLDNNDAMIKTYGGVYWTLMDVDYGSSTKVMRANDSNEHVVTFSREGLNCVVNLTTKPTATYTETYPVVVAENVPEQFMPDMLYIGATMGALFNANGHGELIGRFYINSESNFEVITDVSRSGVLGKATMTYRINPKNIEKVVYKWVRTH